MKKKKAGRAFLWSGIALVLLAVGFVWYALNHPECGTPFGLPLAGAGFSMACTCWELLQCLFFGSFSAKKDKCINVW